MPRKIGIITDIDGHFAGEEVIIQLMGHMDNIAIILRGWLKEILLVDTLEAWVRQDFSVVVEKYLLAC